MCKSRTSFNNYGIAQRLRPCNLHSPLSLTINAIVDDHIAVAVAVPLVFAKLSNIIRRTRASWINRLNRQACLCTQGIYTVISALSLVGREMIYCACLTTSQHM
jgi:hypothetical protein